MKLSKNKTVSLNLISTILLQGMTFFTTPIFSKLLGPANYGIAAVYLTWVMLIAAVFSLQAGGAVGIAYNDFPKSEKDHYRFSIMVLIICSFLLFSIVAVPLAAFLTIEVPLVLMAVMHAFGLYCVRYLNLIYTFEFRADRNLLTAVAVSVSTIALSLALVYYLPLEINYLGRIWGQAVPYFLIGIGISCLLLKKGSACINIDYWKYTLPITMPVIFHLISNLALGQSDRVMLQKMCDNASVGIYTLAVTFSGVIQSLWNAFNNSWVAFYYEYSAKDEIEKIRKNTFNYLELFTVLVCGFILLTPEVFKIFAPKEFLPGIRFIPLFALGYLFVFFYSFPVNYEFFNKETKIIAIITAIAAALNIALNYILIKRYLIYGAVLATTIAHGFQFLLHFFAARQIKKTCFPFKLSYFLAPTAAVVACMLLFYLNINWIYRWGLAVSIGIFELRRVYVRKSIF